MNERSILIVDSDAKNLKVLEDTFREASFVTATAKSADEALKILGEASFNIILSDLSAPSIDGYQLLKEIQRNPSQEGQNIVYTSIKSDIWNRVKSLKLGAKDYIVKPIHASEILARVNMVIRRMQKNQKNQVSANNQFSGRLEDLAVIDLVEIFGAEKKTGILTINNENGHSGQIVCNRGLVVSANTQALQAEDAIYKMMHWNRGRFSMLFTEVHVEDEFTISNMGLLLQGAKMMDLRSELLKQLPSLDAVIITTSNFKKITSQKEMNSELKEFLTLFDGERTLGRILDDSHENEIVTLKRIVKLYKLGFLHVLRNFSKGSPLQFRSEHEEDSPDYVPFDASEEFDDMPEAKEAGQENDAFSPSDKSESHAGDFDLNSDELAFSGKKEETAAVEKNKEEEWDDRKNAGKSERSQFGLDKNIAVIAAKSSDLKLFIQNISPENENHKADLNNSMMLQGALRLRGGGQVNVFGITPDEALTETMLHFSDLTLGSLLLIDAENTNWNYQRYLYKTLFHKLNMPIVVVCKLSSNGGESSSTHISRLLDLEEQTPLTLITEIDDASVRQALFALLNLKTKKSPTLNKESLATK